MKKTSLIFLFIFNAFIINSQTINWEKICYIDSNDNIIKNNDCIFRNEQNSNYGFFGTQRFCCNYFYTVKKLDSLKNFYKVYRISEKGVVFENSYNEFDSVYSYIFNITIKDKVDYFFDSILFNNSFIEIDCQNLKLVYSTYDKIIFIDGNKIDTIAIMDSSVRSTLDCFISPHFDFFQKTITYIHCHYDKKSNKILSDIYLYTIYDNSKIILFSDIELVKIIPVDKFSWIVLKGDKMTRKTGLYQAFLFQNGKFEKLNINMKDMCFIKY